MVRRLQQENDALVHDRQELELHNRELKNTNNYLRGELLRATDEIQKHVDRVREMESSERRLRDIVEEQSESIQKLKEEKNNRATNEIQEHVNRARTMEPSERKIRNIVEKQSRGIQQLVREKNAVTRRLKELERSQSEDSATKRRSTTPPNNEAKRFKTEQNNQAIQRGAAEQETVQRTLPARPPTVTPTITNKVESEQTGSRMILDAEEQRVPGLPLVEYGLDDDVVKQLTKLMKRRKAKRSLESFLEFGERYKYFCAHKVLREGMNVSEPPLPSQPCVDRRCNHNFRIMVVETNSGAKLQTAPYTPEV